MSTASFSVRFVEALRARNIEAPSRDTETAISNAERSAKALDELMSKPAFRQMGDKLIKGARQARPSDDKMSFIAVKVLVKIVACLSALGQGRASQLDPYSRSIIATMMHNHGLSNKGAMVALSRSVQFDSTDKVYVIPQRARYNCSVGTASTQMSSSRMMLLYLGMGKVIKNKRDDEFVLLDNTRAQMLMSLFSDKVISEETGEEHNSDELDSAGAAEQVSEQAEQPAAEQPAEVNS